MKRDAANSIVSASDIETLRYYNAAAPTYRASGIGGRNRFLNRFMDRLPKGAWVLDIGCGGGIDTAAMLNNGLRVDAVDDSDAIAASTSQRLDIEVKVMRFEEIDVSQVYQAAWASASLIHVPRPALPGVLKGIFEALKPGGLHFATFKSGGVEGRDLAGRYYNYPTERELRSFYEASAPWVIDATEQYVGGGF